MYRTMLLTAATVLAFSTPVRAEDAAAQPAAAPEQSAFSQAIHSIKNWFGSETPQAAPVADTTTAASDDIIQVPPPVDGAPANIEPAAGFDEDTLQAPPPYYGPQSNATPRATAFDNAASVTAFGDAPSADAAAINAIMPAAGEGEVNAAAMDCDAIMKAAATAEEGDMPEASLIEACKAKAANPAATDAAAPAPTAPMMEPAQPGFEPAPMPAPLPSTQPAAGEPAPAAAPAAEAPKAQ